MTLSKSYNWLSDNQINISDPLPEDCTDFTAFGQTVASRKSVYPCWWRLACWRGFIVCFLSSTWQWYVCLLMEIAFWLLWLFKLRNYLMLDTSTLKLYWFNQVCGSPEHLKQPVSGKTFIFWFPLFLTCSFLISFLRSASYFSFWFVLAALWSCKKRERQRQRQRVKAEAQQYTPLFSKCIILKIIQSVESFTACK